MRKDFFRAACFVLVATSSVGATGCGASKGRGPNYAHTTEPGVAVTDEAFAASVRDLLTSEPGSRERAQRLAGVEARQMARAVSRFRTQSSARGLEAVTGGLYLMRTGELRDGVLGPSGRDALSLAAKEVSGRGDEGRARALYEMLFRLSKEADRKEIQGHLDALGAWTKATSAQAGTVRNARELATMAIARRLLEPTEEAKKEAASRTTQWLQLAIKLRNTLREKRVAPPREEGIEAYVALQSGGRMLVGVHLVDADAPAAVRAADEIGAREFGGGDLVAALEKVARKPSAEAWLDVLHVLRPSGPREGQEEEVYEDKELFRAAAWAAASEAYRLDPTLPEAAGAVAAGLQEYGMAEASPAVLEAAARAHPAARTLGGAMAIVMHAMAMEVEAQDVDAARRAYNAAAPLLALADAAKGGEGKVQPSPGNVRAMMGEIELREGHVPAARKLLEAAFRGERSGAVLATLARIERFDGQLPQATAHLKEALAAPDAAKDAALRGEIGLMLGDIALERGDQTEARGHYTEALKELARARTQGEPENRARVERVLSRVLDRFGAQGHARKALERAYDDAPRDKQQVSATLGLVVGRALVQSDLPTARDGLRRAMSADLEQDELVYFALWVRLLERQHKVPHDGTTERVFSSIVDDGRWVGRLAAYGSGRIRADELTASAKTPAQKTEALFYSGMDRKVAGDAQGAEAMLRQVLKSGGIDLMEVALTRDILNGARATVPGPLPEVGLP